ncbi:DUF1178 family protein [Oricola thermophila]|uniref:DUF1178 family protein n=1 Tax=Oricola thermophila TaxID=2742145 RepID=A0A6N1VHE6_9HYPH|nr:DUF1178 family protein [Oricola thermophila]QKV20208.1 DUF1178 family protein [Oricola thermophila]
MIKFSLICDQGHDFEAWFRNTGDFETQKKRGFLECPSCGSTRISKALMAPNVSTARKREEVAVATGNGAQREIMAKLQEMARAVKKNGEDVGERFPEEARKIHYGESDPRGIYGKATPDEVASLLDEGVEVLPLPDLPEELN